MTFKIHKMEYLKHGTGFVLKFELLNTHKQLTFSANRIYNNISINYKVNINKVVTQVKTKFLI